LKIPPPSPAVLPVTVSAVNVSVPLLSMPPPCVEVFPFSIVNPEMVAVTPDSTTNTWDALLPLTAKRVAPGPVMVTFLVSSIAPAVRVMSGQEPDKEMVSPAEAAETCPGSEPEPDPLQFVTGNVAAVALRIGSCVAVAAIRPIVRLAMRKRALLRLPTFRALDLAL
jgi:hypothetical protein